MVEKLDDVWTNRDFPVLVEVTRRFDETPALPSIMVDQLAAEMGMSRDDVARAGYALKKRGLVVTGGAAEDPVMYFAGVTGDAYLVTGLHPSGQ